MSYDDLDSNVIPKQYLQQREKLFIISPKFTSTKSET